MAAQSKKDWINIIIDKGILGAFFVIFGGVMLSQFSDIKEKFSKTDENIMKLYENKVDKKDYEKDKEALNIVLDSKVSATQLENVLMKIDRYYTEKTKANIDYQNYIKDAKETNKAIKERALQNNHGGSSPN